MYRLASMSLCVPAYRCTLILLLLNSIYGHELEFIDEPSDAYGLENQQITLSCSAVGPPNITITWHKLDNISSSPGSIKVIGNAVYSSISFQLTGDNEGEYFCNASNTLHWIQSKKVSVKIAFLNEKFNLEPQSKVANVGDTVLLECAPPFGLPSPIIEWFKDNSSLLPNNRLQIMDDGSLRIDRITWQDSGYYTCSAKSFAYRRESVRARLTVRQRPYFIMSPKSQSVPVHSVFEMSCRAAGEPPPVVVWRREPSSPGIPYSRVRLLLGGTLRFVSVQTNDSGYYVCRAVSSAGIVEAVAYVDVVSPPGLIVTPPSRLSTYEGNRIELFCSAVGSPSPDVRWLQWSTKKYFFPSASELGRIHVTNSGNLIILAARPEDTSTYECRASSPVGLTRTLTDIQVQFNPKLIPGRIGAVSNSHIFGGLFVSPKAVRIVCGVPSDPIFNSVYGSKSLAREKEISMKSHIMWLYNGESISKLSSSNSRVSVETDGSLLLYPFQPEDVGNYTCSVYRKVSHRFAQYAFIVSLNDYNNSVYHPHTLADLPSPPVDARIMGIGDTWLILKWSDSNPSESSSYRVFVLPQIYSSSSAHSAQHPEGLDHTKVTEDRIKSGRSQKSSELSFRLDKWLTAVEKTYLTQVRITGLVPDTGYWIEVRKVNNWGMSSGVLVPNIVYTMKKPSDVRYPYASKVNGTLSDLSLKHPGAMFPGGQTAVDFQELVSTFQSIDLHRISIRTLTSSELLVSWAARSSNEVLKRIDGFRINVRSVPMSRCIAAVTSKPPSFLSSAHGNSEQHGSVDIYDNEYSDFSFASSIHCSFTSSKLLEQTVLMANTNSLHLNNKDMGVGEQESQSIIVMQSVSRDYPDAKAVVGGLLPFSCYETDIEAFKDDPTYGRILSRSSRSELALTLDAPPSFSPELISVEWLFQINPSNDEYSRSQEANYSTSPPDGIRLSWKPLVLTVAHGAILGYTVHILANESQFSRSLHVSADVHSKDIQGLNPFVDYVIYISGVNCRGEGVRGPGYHLRSVTAGLKGPAKSSGYEVNIFEHFTFPSWAYVLLCGFIIFWIIFGLLIHFVVRQTSKKQCFKSSTHYFTSGSNMNLQNRKSAQSIGIREFSFGICCTSMAFRKSKSGLHSDADKTMGVILLNNGQQEIGTGHLLNRLGSSQSKLYGDKPVSDGCTHIPSQSFEISNHNLIGNEDIEIYGNNEPSVCSKNVIHLPSVVTKLTPVSSGTTTVPSQHDLVEENLRNDIHSVSRPKLPDSINIPFPVPPVRQSNLYSSTQNFQYRSSLLELPNSPDLFMPSNIYAANQLDEPESPRNFTSEDTVPAYASCSVFSVCKTEPNDHTGTSGVMLVHNNNNLCLQPKEDNDLGDHLKSVEPSGLINNNHSSVSNCNWQFIPHSPIIREEKTQNIIPPPPEYPPPPLPSSSSKLSGLPNLWIPNSGMGELFQRPELRDHHLRFVSDDSSLPSGGTYLSNCYSPTSGAYAETHQVSCAIPNQNIRFHGIGSCIVNNQANSFYELSPSNQIKPYLSPNGQKSEHLRESTCFLSGVHRLSPLGRAYPNTSVIINPGQFESHMRVKNCQSLTDGSGNAGSSSSVLSGTSGLGSTAIGSGSAKCPGYRHPSESQHGVNGLTSGSDSSNCSNLQRSMMHRNNITSSPFSSPSEQQIVHSNSKPLLLSCNASSSSSSTSKHEITKEVGHFSRHPNNTDNNTSLSKSFQYAIPENILSNNCMQLSSSFKYNELPQRNQQQSKNSLVVCNPVISGLTSSHELPGFSSQQPLPNTTALNHTHHFSESIIDGDYDNKIHKSSPSSTTMLVSSRSSDKPATGNGRQSRTIRT
ncbi:unnamed protein product [Heterobilharzia americana]|nr:unnamed protein product [Heterobilharzia americana]